MADTSLATLVKIPRRNRSSVMSRKNLSIMFSHDGLGDYARWWLTPSWAPEVSSKYSMFNARSETLVKSRAFRGPFRHQRGIVPMSSFIEWRSEDGTKQPWLISNEARTLAAAALWEVWTKDGNHLLSCTIITTAAAPSFKPWHNRMPVLLDKSEFARWLDNDREISQDDPLFQPELKQAFTLYPVDKSVGNSRNKDSESIAPVGDSVTLLRPY